MGDMNWKLEAGVQPEFAIDRIRAGALEELEGLDTLTQVRSSRRVPCRTVAPSAQSFPVSARASWLASHLTPTRVWRSNGCVRACALLLGRGGRFNSACQSCRFPCAIYSQIGRQRAAPSLPFRPAELTEPTLLPAGATARAVRLPPVRGTSEGLRRARQVLPDVQEEALSPGSQRRGLCVAR